jgi:hypothetical protein
MIKTLWNKIPSSKLTAIILHKQNYYILSDSICSPPIPTLTYKMFHILYINWI